MSRLKAPLDPAPYGGKRNYLCPVSEFNASQGFWIYHVAQKGEAMFRGVAAMAGEQSWLQLEASLEEVAVAQV